MRTLLIGLLVGGISGFAIQKYVLTDESETIRDRRARQAHENAPAAVRGDKTGDIDIDALRARILELEGLLAKAPEDGDPIARLLGGVEVPTTDEGIDLLFEEWSATDDLDKLLALIRALLLKGEPGYPKLTKVLLRVVGKGMAGKIKEEALLERIVPALKIAMKHEKELVGYVGYLLTNKEVPQMMRTGAMGAAMFLSINRVRGSDKFAPLLLEAFMQGGAGMDRDQGQMLITAMGMLGQKEAVDPLLAMLNDPQKKRLHRTAIEALGQIGDERAVGTLVERLRTSDKNEWWSSEITALARIGTPQAVAAAEEHLATLPDPDRFFNQAGAYLSERTSTKVINLVAERFRNNPGSGNMWSAMRGLSKAGTPEANALMEEIARSSTQDWVKKQAQRHIDERRKLAEATAED